MSDCHVVEDDRFRFLVQGNAWLETLHSGARWAEGPVWFGDSQTVVWSDIPNDRMLQWADGAGVRVFRQPAGHANGNTRDREGRLLSCLHGGRGIARTELDGRVRTLVDRWDGKRLNSPNDLTVKSDGSVWFTDPPYGIMSDYEGHKADSEIGRANVYRFEPASGRIDVVSDDLDRPNGICFSPDERTLYVSDTSVSHDPAGHRHIVAFDVGDDGRLARRRIFAEIDVGCADGFRCDVEGNVWTSAGDGVHCYSPQGERLGRIRVPETVSNLCFGGPRRNRLFITATTSLYAIYVAANGAQWP